MTQKTITQRIRELYLNERLSVDDIRERLRQDNIDKGKHFIRNVVYRIRVQEGLINPTEQQTILTPTTPETPRLTLKIIEENNTLILYVKSDEKYEKWLKDTKELKDSNFLWGISGNTGKFYYQRLDNDDTLSYDNVNSPIITGRNKHKINLGILRLQDISKGLKFDLSEFGLIPTESLKKCCSDFVKFYDTIYSRKVLNHKVNIEMYNVE